MIHKDNGQYSRVLERALKWEKMTMDTVAYLLDNSTTKLKNISNVVVFSYYSCHH
jgi:hypothetical protein